MFNPYTPSNKNLATSVCYKLTYVRNETGKRTVREVEHSSFTPRVLAATEVLENEATFLYIQGIYAISEIGLSLQHHPVLVTMLSSLSLSIQATRGARSARGLHVL